LIGTRVLKILKIYTSVSRVFMDVVSIMNNMSEIIVPLRWHLTPANNLYPLFSPDLTMLFKMYTLSGPLRYILMCCSNGTFFWPPMRQCIAFSGYFFCVLTGLIMIGCSKYVLCIIM